VKSAKLLGKPNQNIPVAPLKPIPTVEESFSIYDCRLCGAITTTKAGNQYLLTIMCTSTRFPEAVPLRNIKAKRIVGALVKFLQ